jgi:uncharacterized protein YkwD
MRAPIFAALVGLTFVVASTAADACTRSLPGQAERTLVPTQRINQDLFDAAVRAEVNFHRCRAGLSKLNAAGNSLAREAKTHSTWMAKQQTLSHQNSIPGKGSLSQRVKASGVRFRTGSENIGMVHRFQIDNRRFRILDSASCKFSTYEGQSLPAHNYASLARHAVNLWMNSPGHRKNILDRRINRMSSAVAYDPDSPYCGQFYMTQNFVG